MAGLSPCDGLSCLGNSPVSVLQRQQKSACSDLKRGFGLGSRRWSEELSQNSGQAKDLAEQCSVLTWAHDGHLQPGEAVVPLSWSVVLAIIPHSSCNKRVGP